MVRNRLYQLDGSTTLALTKHQAVGLLRLVDILKEEGGHRVLSDIKMGSDFGRATDQTCHQGTPEG